MSILTAFNNHFMELLEDVHRIFPENRELKKSMKALEMLRKTNPKAVITLWKSNVVLPYKNEIMNGDVSFFLNKDYTKDLQENGFHTNEIVGMIENVKHDISKLDDANQQKAIKYVQNLTKLAELYR